MADILEQVKEDESSNKPLQKTAHEMIVGRIGKVKAPEIYSSKTEFVVIFPTDYSIVVRDTGSRKHAKVEVYYGVGDVTKQFFPGKSHKKVRRDVVSALFDRLSDEEAIEILKKEVSGV